MGKKKAKKEESWKEVLGDEKFTPRQLRFIEAYQGNAREAAEYAGYSAKTAHSAGHKLLTKTKIRRAIQIRREEEASLTIASRQERQRFWSEVMANPDEKMEHRLRAAELLGKSEADFSERVQVDGTIEHTLGALFDPARRRAVLAEVAREEVITLAAESVVPYE